MSIDLNADVGEGAGGDEEIFACITSANIACGGHAGDERSMKEAVERALRRGVAVGAHPGFEDRADFGRSERPISPAEARGWVLRQAEALKGIAESMGARVAHVKPHGALYNMSARDAALAEAIAQAVREFDPNAVLFGLAGSASIAEARKIGLRAANEVFADRRYRAGPALVPRSRPDAVIHEVEEAVAQAVRMVREGRVRTIDGGDEPVIADTVCLHGDTPAAVLLARRLRRALEQEGLRLRAP